MFNKQLKKDLRRCQNKVASLSLDLEQVPCLRDEANRLRQLYEEKQKEANERANRLPNFIWGLARHEATLECSKPHYGGSDYRFLVSFKPHLHSPGDVHQPLDEEAHRNLLNNLMLVFNIGFWKWVGQTASLAKTYDSGGLDKAPAEMEKAEAELQALLDETIRVQRMKVAFEPKEPAKKEK